MHFERMSEIMPATVHSMNIFCPSQGLTGLDWGYNCEGTSDASTQDIAEDFENNVIEETSSAMSQVSAAVLFTSVVLIFCLACSHFYITISVGCCLCFSQMWVCLISNPTPFCEENQDHWCQGYQWVDTVNQPLWWQYLSGFGHGPIVTNTTLQEGSFEACQARGVALKEWLADIVQCSWEGYQCCGCICFNWLWWSGVLWDVGLW